MSAEIYIRFSTVAFMLVNEEGTMAHHTITGIWDADILHQQLHSCSLRKKKKKEKMYH